MTYQPNNPISPANYPPPKKSRTGLIVGLVAAAVFAVIAVLCGVGVAGSVDNPPDAGPGRELAAPKLTPPPGKTPPPASTPSPEAAAPASETTLTAKDVKVTIKVTDKQCFGSAGCNLEFDVKAGWPPSKVAAGDSCDVTYELRGFTDEQTGTLTVRSDGQYEVDSFNFGQTSKRSAKVSARVTEVECS